MDPVVDVQVTVVVSVYSKSLLQKLSHLTEKLFVYPYKIKTVKLDIYWHYYYSSTGLY